MIAKGEFSEAISDVVLLLEKQVSDFSRRDLTTFLEVLNSNNDDLMPVIVLGTDGKLYFKDIESKTIRLISRESIQEILDYDEFLKTGNIVLRKAS